MSVIIMEGIENSYFLVPTEIADKYLTSASDAELRLLLFLLRNTGRSFELKDISEALRLDEKDISEAFEFWKKNSVLEKKNGRYRLRKPVRSADRPDYGSDVISFKLNSDKDLARLIDKTEKLYAKLLSPAELSILVGLVDWTGYEPETLYFIIEYFFSDGKKLKYVEKAANEWHERGIDDDKKVRSYIEKLKGSKKLEFKVAKIIGADNRALTETERKNISVWLNDYGFDEDVIALAYDKTINSTGKYSVSYMNVILRTWNQKGYKSREEIESMDSNEAKTASKSSKKSSLDVDTFVKYAWDIIQNDKDEE